MPNLFLAAVAQKILTTALETPYGILVHVVCTADAASPALRGRQILYHYRTADHESLRIYITGEAELKIVKT